MISVLMTVYNGMPYLTQSIPSILNQTYSDLELVIVDDGSTDDSVSYIKNLQDKRIKLIIAKRVGRGKALNVGLKYCNGEYIAINDADDFSSVDRLEKQLTFLNQRKDVGLLGTWKSVCENDISKTDQMPTTDFEIRKFFCKGQPIQHSTVMLRQEVINKVGGYNETLPFLLDRDLFLRIAMITKCMQLPLSLVEIHRSKNQYFYNTFTGYTREVKSLKFRIKAIFIFRFPKIWILREIARSCWSLSPGYFRIKIIKFFKLIKWKR